MGWHSDILLRSDNHVDVKGARIMARKPAITRTITVEDVTISAANEQTGKLQALTITIPVGSKSDLGRLRVIRPQLPPHIQPLRVVKVSPPETHIYRMSIPDFVSHATIYDCRDGIKTE